MHVSIASTILKHLAVVLFFFQECTCVFNILPGVCVWGGGGVLLAILSGFLLPHAATFGTTIGVGTLIPPHV